MLCILLRCVFVEQTEALSNQFLKCEDLIRCSLRLGRGRRCINPHELKQGLQGRVVGNQFAEIIGPREPS